MLANRLRRWPNVEPHFLSSFCAGSTMCLYRSLIGQSAWHVIDDVITELEGRSETLCTVGGVDQTLQMAATKTTLQPTRLVK